MPHEAGPRGKLRLRWYLCGPISGYPEQSYRVRLRKLLKAYDHTYYDPKRVEQEVSLPARYTKRVRGVARNIMKRDEYNIRKCDAVVAYLPCPSDGAAMELAYAHQCYIPTVAIIPRERKVISPFLSKADYILKSFEEFEDKILRRPSALLKMLHKYAETK